MTNKAHTVCSLRFREPPHKRGGWLTLLRNGGIEPEPYDFSEHTQRFMGSDVAWILTLEPSAVRQLAQVSRSSGDGKGLTGASRATLLWISERCANYLEFRKLLDAHEIPCSVVFDGYT